MKHRCQRHPVTATALSLCLLQAAIVRADVFTWTDNGGNNNWINSSNWSQSGGSGDYPGEKRDTDDVFLDGTFSNNSAKFDIDLTTGTSPNSYTVADFKVETDNSADQWVVQIGAQSSATLTVRSVIGLKILNSGSFTCEADLELGTNNVLAGASGQGGTFNGRLIGGSSSVFNANASVNVGGNYPANGVLRFTATDNDGFTGTVKTGRSKVEITAVNGLRHATVEQASTNWGNATFIHPDNALLGALTGIGQHALNNSLKVGNNGTNFTYSGDLSGSSDLRKVGAGVWTLSGTNLHTGTTYIDAGQIKLGNALALQDSKVFFNINNPINLNGMDPTFGGLDGVGALDLGTSTTTIGGTASASVLGNLSGTGTIIIDRSGTQYIGNSATFSGDYQLLSGTLSMGAGPTWNSGAMLFGGGTLAAQSTVTSNRGLDFLNPSSVAPVEVAGSQVLTWAGAIGGGSANLVIQKLGSGELAITHNANTFDGTLELDAGDVSVTTTALGLATVDLGIDNALTLIDATTTLGGLSGTGNLNLGANKTLIFGANDRATSYSGDLSGSGSSTFSVTGSGAFTFSGNSSLTQPANLTGGSFIIDGNTTTSSLSNLDSTVGTSVEGTGRVGQFLDLDGDVSPSTPGGGALGTIRAGGMILDGSFQCDVDGASNDLLVTDGVFSPENGTLDLSFAGGAPSQPAYVLVDYGFLGGSGTFASVLNLPTGYRIDYAYDVGGDTTHIALVEDTTAPSLVSIALNGATSDPTNADSIDFDITFDEDVTGVDASDFDISYGGSTGTATLSGSGATYTLTIPSITGDGLLTVSLGAGHGITDVAGNGLNPSAASDSVTIDNTPPTRVSATTSEPDPTNATSIAYSYVFSEPVTGFDDPADTEFVLLSGSVTGGVTQVHSDDATTFAVTLGNLAGDGEVRFRVKNVAVSDLAGNSLTGPTASDSRTIDQTAPTLSSITLDAAISDPTNAGTIAFDITFDETVVDLTAGHFNVSFPGGTGTPGLSGSGTDYILTIPGVTGDGTMTVSLGSVTGVTDLAGNGLAPSALSDSVVIDNTAPALSSIALDPGIDNPTNANTIVFDITFDEAVENVDAGDFSVSFPGSTDAPVLGGSGSAYTLTVSSVAGEGTMNVSLDGANDIADAVGNPLAASAASASVAIDNTAPTLDSIVLNAAISDPTTVDTVEFDLTFGDDVENVDAGDFDISFPGNWGAASVSGSGALYTLTIPGISGDGTLTVSLNAGNDITDPAGNALAASAASDSVVIDNTAPTLNSITLGAGISSPTNTSSVVFDFAFSEVVENVDASDFSVSFGGTTGTPTLGGSGAAYTLTIPGITGDGTLTVGLDGGNDIADALGNALDPSLLTGTVVIDNTGPNATGISRILGPPGPVTYDFSVSFDEVVTGFDTYSDIVVTTTGTATATGASFSGLGSPYTVSLTGVSGSGTLTITVSTGSDVVDLAGNPLVSSVTSAPQLVGTPYDIWAAARGLTPGNDGAYDDPNHDGRPNIEHFAHDTDPLGNGGNEGKQRVEIADTGGQLSFVWTIPVRNGAIFQGTPLTSGSVDGILYTIHGDDDLSGSDLSVAETIPLPGVPLPPLGDYDGVTGPDYTYRSFFLKNGIVVDRKGFMWSEFVPAP